MGQRTEVCESNTDRTMHDEHLSNVSINAVKQWYNSRRHNIKATVPGRNSLLTLHSPQAILHRKLWPCMIVLGFTSRARQVLLWFKMCSFCRDLAIYQDSVRAKVQPEPYFQECHRC
jgi:hypothetical protein